MDKIKLLLYSLLLAGFMFSCAGEEDDIFSDSAANRLTKAIQEYNDLLCSSPNGWIFEYFPTTTSQGYIFLVRFEQGGLADMACKNRWINNGGLLRDTCLFRMIGDNGPVLTFDTYSEIIHYFCGPYDIPGTEANEVGKGFEGDYEFMTLSGDEDQINLKGKKRGTRLTLRKLEEGQDWEEYFALLDNMETTMFNRGVIPLVLYMPDGNNFNLSFQQIDEKDDNGVTLKYYPTEFSAYPVGGDAISQTEKIPFVVTEYGIRLNEPFEEGKYTAQRFELTDDKNSLVSKEDPNIEIKTPANSDLFFYIMDMSNSSTDYRWTVINSEENMSSSFSSAFKRVENSAKANNNRTFNYIGFNKPTFNTNSNWKYSSVIRIQSGSTGSDGMYLFDLTKVNDSEIKTTFRGFEEGYAQETTLRNGKTFYDLFDGLPELVELMNSDFEIVSQSEALNPKKLRFVDKNNSEIWFDLQFITQKK